MTYKRVLANFIAFLFGCGFTLLLGEIALRFYFGNLDFFAMHDPDISVVNQLSPGIIRGCREKFHYSINRQGMRGDDYPENSSTYRILAMGGSTTICSFLDDARAWPALVQKKLPQTADGRSVWVGNIGKSGLTTRSHVLQMAYLTPQYPVDAIVLLVGINDLVLRIWEDEQYDPHFLDNADSKYLLMFKTFTILPDSLYHPFYKNLGLWKLARRTKSCLKNYISQDKLIAEIRQGRDLRCNSHELTIMPDLTEALGEFAANITQIIQMAKRQNLRLIMMTQPVLWNASLTQEEKAALLPFGFVGYITSGAKHDYYPVEIMAACMRLYNDRLLSLCRQFDVECIDLAARVPCDTQVFYDDCHFTELGAEIVTEVVADYLHEKPPFQSVGFKFSNR